jgi:hypothetical protein
MAYPKWSENVCTGVAPKGVWIALLSKLLQLKRKIHTAACAHTSPFPSHISFTEYTKYSGHGEINSP